MAFDYRQEYSRYRQRVSGLKALYQKPIVRTYSLLVLTFLTISFLGVTAIKPTLITIAQLVKEIEDKRATSQQLTKKIESLSQAQIEYQRIKPKLQGLNRAVPSRPEFAELVWQIEYLAAKHQLNLLGFQVGTVTLLGEDKVQNLDDSKLPGTKFTFNLNLNGEFENLQQFTDDLEDLQRIIQVAEVNFSTDIKKSKQKDLGSLELTLVTESFYLQEENSNDQT